MIITCIAGDLMKTFIAGDLVRLIDNHYLRNHDGMDIGIVLYLTEDIIVAGQIENFIIPNLVVMWQTGEIFPVPNEHVDFLSRNNNITM
jgi:hypothetical protein